MQTPTPHHTHSPDSTYYPLTVSAYPDTVTSGVVQTQETPMTKPQVPYLKPHGYKRLTLKEARKVVKRLGYKLPRACHEMNLGGGLWLANLTCQLSIGKAKGYALIRY